MKKTAVFLTAIICGFLLCSSSPSLDGRAVVADEGEFPQGLFAKTVGYLPGDNITVTNPSNAKTADILVIGSLDPSEGIAILLSPEAANALNIQKNSNNLVKLTKRSGEIDECVNGSCVITSTKAQDDFNNSSQEDPVSQPEVAEESPVVEENTVAEESPVVEDNTVAEESPVVEETSEEVADESTPTSQTNESQEVAQEQIQPEEPEIKEEIEVSEESVAEDTETAEESETPVIADETVVPSNETQSDSVEEIAEENVMESETAADSDEEQPQTPEEIAEETVLENVPEENPAAQPENKQVSEKVDEEPLEEVAQEEPQEDVAEVAEVQDNDDTQTESRQTPMEQVEPDELAEIDDETPKTDETVPEEAAEPEVVEKPAEEESVEEIQSEEVVEEETVTEELPPQEIVQEETKEDDFEAIVLVPAEDNPPVVQETEDNTIKAVETESVIDTAIVPEKEEPQVDDNKAVSTKQPEITVNSQLESNKFYVQIATYSKPENVRNIENKYGPSYPLTVTQKGNNYVVMIGPLNEDEYGVVLARFKAHGFKDAFLKKGK